MSMVFQAGALWDPKEETFRNYGQLLGPHDDFELVLWCDADVENEVKFTVAYVDPAQVIAGSYDVTLPKDQYVLVHKPVFRKPLRPGKELSITKNLVEAYMCMKICLHVLLKQVYMTLYIYVHVCVCICLWCFDILLSSFNITVTVHCVCCFAAMFFSRQN